MGSKSGKHLYEITERILLGPEFVSSHPQAHSTAENSIENLRHELSGAFNPFFNESIGIDMSANASWETVCHEEGEWPPKTSQAQRQTQTHTQSPFVCQEGEEAADLVSHGSAYKPYSISVIVGTLRKRIISIHKSLQDTTNDLKSNKILDISELPV